MRNLHAGPQKYLYRSSVTRLLQRLNPRRFVRIHRSAADNTSRIRELQSVFHGDFALILKDGTELTLSRAYRSPVEAWLRQPICTRCQRARLILPARVRRVAS